MGSCWSEMCTSSESEVVDLHAEQSLRRSRRIMRQQSISPKHGHHNNNNDENNNDNADLNSDCRKSNDDDDDRATSKSAKEREEERLRKLNMQSSMRDLLSQSVKQNKELEEYKAFLSPTRAGNNQNNDNKSSNSNTPEGGDDVFNEASKSTSSQSLEAQQGKKSTSKRKRRKGTSKSPSRASQIIDEDEDINDDNNNSAPTKKKQKIRRTKSGRQVVVSIKSADSAGSDSHASSASSDDDDDGPLFPVEPDVKIINQAAKNARENEQQYPSPPPFSPSSPGKNSSTSKRRRKSVSRSSVTELSPANFMTNQQEQFQTYTSPAQKAQTEYLKQARDLVIETKTQGRNVKSASPSHHQQQQQRRTTQNGGGGVSRTNSDAEEFDPEEDEARKIFQIEGEEEEHKGKTVEEILKSMMSERERQERQEQQKRELEEQQELQSSLDSSMNPGGGGPPLQRKFTKPRIGSPNTKYHNHRPAAEDCYDDPQNVFPTSAGVDREEINEKHALGGFGAERDITTSERRKERTFGENNNNNKNISPSRATRTGSQSPPPVDDNNNIINSGGEYYYRELSPEDKRKRQQQEEEERQRQEKEAAASAAYADDDEQDEAERDKRMFAAAFTPSNNDEDDMRAIFPVTAEERRQKQLALQQQNLSHHLKNGAGFSTYQESPARNGEVFYGGRVYQKRKINFGTSKSTAAATTPTPSNTANHQTATKTKHFSPFSLGENMTSDQQQQQQQQQQQPKQNKEVYISPPPPTQQQPSHSSPSAPRQSNNNILTTNRNWTSKLISQQQQKEKENNDEDYNKNDERRFGDTTPEITLQLRALRLYSVICSEEAHERRWLCGEFLCDQYEDAWYDFFTNDLAPVDWLFQHMKYERLQILQECDFSRKRIYESERKEYRSIDILVSRRVAAASKAAALARKEREEQKYAAPRVFRPQMMLLGKRNQIGENDDDDDDDDARYFPNNNSNQQGEENSLHYVASSFTAFSESNLQEMEDGEDESYFNGLGQQQQRQPSSSPAGYSSSPFQTSTSNGYNSNSNIVRNAAIQRKRERNFLNFRDLVSTLQKDEQEWRFLTMQDQRREAIVLVDHFVSLGCFPLLGALDASDRLPIVSRAAAREVAERRRVAKSQERLEEIASAYHYNNNNNNSNAKTADSILTSPPSHQNHHYSSPSSVISINNSRNNSNNISNNNNLILTPIAKASTLLRLCEIDQEEDRLSVESMQARAFSSIVKSFATELNVVKAHDIRRKNQKRTVELRMLLQSTRMEAQSHISRVGRGYLLRKRLARVWEVNKSGPYLQFLLRKHEWTRRQLETEEVEEMSYLVTYASYSGFLKHPFDSWPGLLPIRRYPLQSLVVIETLARRQIEDEWERIAIKFDTRNLILQTKEFIKEHVSPRGRVVSVQVRDNNNNNSNNSNIDNNNNNDNSSTRYVAEDYSVSSGNTNNNNNSSFYERFSRIVMSPASKIMNTTSSQRRQEYHEAMMHTPLLPHQQATNDDDHYNNGDTQHQNFSDAYSALASPIRPVVISSQSASNSRERRSSPVPSPDWNGADVRPTTRIYLVGERENEEDEKDGPVFISNDERKRLAKEEKRRSNSPYS